MRWLFAIGLLCASAARAEWHLGLEVGAAGASLTTGIPHRPHSGGVGLTLGFLIGTPLTKDVTLYYVNRLPGYLFADEMPGLGFAFETLDFNAVVLKGKVSEDLSLAIGPSFDFMVPFFGNRAFGGGVDVRLDRVLRDTGGRAQITIGLFAHPSVLSYSEKHGYFTFIKAVVVAGISMGAVWR